VIELDERDIKAVSSSRFSRKTQKYLLGITLGCVGSFVLIFLSGLPHISSWFILIPFCVLVGGTINWDIKRRRAEKALVEEWKKKEQ